MDDLDWQVLDSSEPIDLVLFDARFDRVRHPRSGDEFQRLVLESADWVSCVAIDDEGTFVMVRQYRFGIGATTLETPGGMVDPGEEHGQAIQRELLEETGFGGGTWTPFGTVEPNPAFHDHLCHHWLAEGVRRVRDPTPVAGEYIEVTQMTEIEVVVAVRSGTIRHSLALSALSRVLDLWGHRELGSTRGASGQ